ncbi:N-acetylglucosamine-1-phosphodiester alpha-N-acetylglucosaminidase-like [Symphorus nematophorus]
MPAIDFGGHITLVRDPLRTLSVLEPGGPGGCEKHRRATAEQTAVAAGCLYAQNAGFFTGTSNRRLGDVVSDGRMVRDSGGQQNAQFGIRKDGSLVFGYLSQEDVLDRSNPFVRLVSGVVWLLRKGEIYINQSPKAEDVLSARTVVGHDADGNLILFHVDGKSKKRGMNLWEVADFLKKNGVINAIDLDGGGSSSFVINGTLASYPPDRCKSDSRWRCARDVSTVLCVHRRRCEPADRGGHGDCVNGRRRCQQGWRGAACDSLVCRPPACGPHGVCSANGCVCDAGWRGKNCSQGHMTLVRDPLRTLSVSEPGGPGGCEKRRRATAEQTAVAAGCLYAQNAGFFTGTSDRRLGDVVSDGRMVRDSGGQQNAQFGIRKDGSLVFGYLSQEDVLDRSNPFVQLVSGVVWLLRKGEIYINQSPKAECDDTVEHV